MNCSRPGPSVHGILQARTLEWAATPPAGHLPGPGMEPTSLTPRALAGDSLSLVRSREDPTRACCAQSLSRVRVCVTPWTRAHQASLSTGNLQARILE